jgi:alpha/beta superfamily hydrolase
MFTDRCRRCARPTRPVARGHSVAAMLIVLLALTTTAATAEVADTARETRWAEQIVPQLVVGDAVWLRTAKHPRVLALYAEPAQPTRRAVIVVHGAGVNPDWNLIGVLRTALADQGFATLSLQMPVLAAEAPRDGYVDLFPDAGERLDAATAWLRAKGYARIGVVSHSMGAGMVNAWLGRYAGSVVDAWVPVGLLVPFAAPLRQPVLDVIAERDFPEVLAHAKTRANQLPHDTCSAALVIAGTDHYFGDAAARLASTIAPFIKRALDGGCR